MKHLSRWQTVTAAGATAAIAAGAFGLNAALADNGGSADPIDITEVEEGVAVSSGESAASQPSLETPGDDDASDGDAEIGNVDDADVSAPSEASVGSNDDEVAGIVGTASEDQAIQDVSEESADSPDDPDSEDSLDSPDVDDLSESPTSQDVVESAESNDSPDEEDDDDDDGEDSPEPIGSDA